MPRRRFGQVFWFALVSFRSLLKHHWLEESQHARFDALEIAKLASGASSEVIETAINDYDDILRELDGVLARQTELDLTTLERIGAPLVAADRELLREQQHASYRRCFILDGLEHPALISTIRRLTPGAEARMTKLRAELR